MADRAGVFLDRRGYRRRRLADAARALPVLGAFLFLLPALGAGGAGASGPLVLLLAAWGALIALAAAIAPRLAGSHEDEDEAGGPRARGEGGTVARPGVATAVRGAAPAAGPPDAAAAAAVRPAAFGTDATARAGDAAPPGADDPVDAPHPSTRRDPAPVPGDTAAAGPDPIRPAPAGPAPRSRGP